MLVNLCWKRLVCLASSSLLVFVLALPVGAQTILIDFGNDSSFGGVSVPNPDSNGNYWNSVHSAAFYPGLIDIAGNPTAVNFGFSSSNGEDSFNGPAGVTTQVPGPTPSEIAATDIDVAALGALGGSNEAAMDFYVSSTFQIQALDLSKTYDLTFFGSHKFNNDNTTRYTIYTDGTFSTPITSADLEVGVNDAHNRDTVVTISGVSPQADSIIYVGFEGASGDLGYLNTMQIVAIPEPSTLLLLAGTLALACGYRRR